MTKNLKKLVRWASNSKAAEEITESDFPVNLEKAKKILARRKAKNEPQSDKTDINE